MGGGGFIWGGKNALWESISFSNINLACLFSLRYKGLMDAFLILSLHHLGFSVPHLYERTHIKLVFTPKKRRCTPTATTSTLKTKSNMAKLLAHIYITQGDYKEDKHNITNTNIKKTTQDDSEGYKDNTDGKLPKKMIVNNIS